MRGVPAEGESYLAYNPAAIQEELKLDSSQDLSLVKGLCASRSNIERRPSSRGDHRHAATLPSGESSEKAHLGCHVYGIRWLACSQIACNWKGMHETPCTHNFHCVALLLCGFPGGVLGPATAHAFSSFGACTKLLLVWLRGLRIL